MTVRTRISRRAACSSAVWCLCADVFITALYLLGAICLVLLSWSVFVLKTIVMDASGGASRVLETISVVLAAGAYCVLLEMVVYRTPPAPLVRVAVASTRVCLGHSRTAEARFLAQRTRTRCTRQAHEDSPEDDLDDTARLLMPLAAPPETAALAVDSPPPTHDAHAATVCATLQERSCSPLAVRAFFLFAVSVIHVVCHSLMPDKFRLSQELLVSAVRVGVDVAMVVLLSGAALVRALRRSVRAGLLTARQLRVLGVTSVCGLVFVALWAISGTVYRAWRLDTREHLSRLMLGGHADACAVLGTSMKSSVTRSTVWPAVLPRRTFNFFTGSESCDRRGRFHPLAWLDSNTHTLVLSPTCWDGRTMPRLYVERPVSNDLYRFPQHKYAQAFTTDLEQRFGRGPTPGLIVHRDAATQHITEVEVAPSRLTRRERPMPAAVSSPEAQARAHWPTATSPSPLSVLTLPLGESVTYFVRCPSLDARYEEMHLYPKLLNTTEALAEVPQRAEGTGVVGVTEPPGSVLLLVFDSTSRSEAVRSLPLFTAWLRDFQARQAAKGTDGYVLVEPKHHTVIGSDTTGNTAVLLTGSTYSQWNILHAHRNVSQFDSSAAMFTADAKIRYGDRRIRTSLTHGMCEDLWRSNLYTPIRPGAGDPVVSTDMYTYTPFCHQQYGASFGNLLGPYSIMRRCIDQRNVHHYLLNHTTYLMKHRMRRATRKPTDDGEFFFDITYVMDAHEGTHGVLNLVDHDLTEFMKQLEHEVGFFDNPLNAFLFAADHGNHMGHYHMNDAGAFEHTNPALVMAVHPELLRRVDVMKHRPEGTAARHLGERMSQFSSNLDLHLTLRDILGVPDMGVHLNDDRRVPPRSHFDSRDVVPRECADYRSIETNRCTLSFCE